MMSVDVYDVGAAVGVAAVGVGLAAWSMPAALVFFGAVLLACSVAGARVAGRSQRGS